jgi:hypothetical protein
VSKPLDFFQTQQDWLCDAIRALGGDITILTRKMTTGFEKPAGADDDVRQTHRRPEVGGSQPVGASSCRVANIRGASEFSRVARHML